MQPPLLDLVEWEALHRIATHALPVDHVAVRIRRTLEAAAYVRLDSRLLVPTYRGLDVVASHFGVTAPSLRGAQTAVLQRVAECPQGLEIKGTRIQTTTLLALEKRRCVSVRWAMPGVLPHVAWLAVAGFVALRARLPADLNRALFPSSSAP